MAATPHVIEDYVRWSDVDLAGILCYGSYLRFFEIAETELFRAAGLAHRDGFERFGIWFPRASLHIDFYEPARLDDRLRVAAYIARVGNKSLTVNFDMSREDRSSLSATGHEVLVCVERGNLQSRPIPPEVIKSLSPYTLGADAARAALGVDAP